MLVALTPSGNKQVDAAFAELIEQERQLLAPMSDQERGQLAGLLKVLMAPLAE